MSKRYDKTTPGVPDPQKNNFEKENNQNETSVYILKKIQPRKYFPFRLSLRMKYFIRVTVIISLLFILQACGASRKNRSSGKVVTAETNVVTKNNTVAGKFIPYRIIDTKNADPGSVVDFAERLIGTRYKYGSAVKEQGFDCSGFITYVFNHFNIQVPRISKDFTKAGTPVPFDESKPGDLILFTGTDTTGWVVGHMGIITQNEDGNIKFIHSSSGKSIGVIISGMSKYYETRFVKVIRVFQQ